MLRHTAAPSCAIERATETAWERSGSLMVGASSGQKGGKRIWSVRVPDTRGATLFAARRYPVEWTPSAVFARFLLCLRPDSEERKQTRARRTKSTTNSLQPTHSNQTRLLSTRADSTPPSSLRFTLHACACPSPHSSLQHG
jgi:hypothetical protein